MSFIEFRNVTKSYGADTQKINAVKQISFTIEKGEFTVILGPSGAGKSTILNLLGGMDTPTDGIILVDQIDITKLNEKRLTDYRATDIGFVFQFYNLIPTLTVYENVALIKEAAPKSSDPNQVLEAVGLADRKRQFPTEISGGEQQRVSIARAICKNPKLLLCDEPTGALDSETGAAVLKLLWDMCKLKGHTVVIVTHNISIAELADRIIYIKNGIAEKIVQQVCPKQVSEVVW